MTDLSYEARCNLIRRAFRGAPLTFIPALTITALELSLATGAWAKSGLAILAQRVEDKRATGTDAVRNRITKPKRTSR